MKTIASLLLALLFAGPIAAQPHCPSPRVYHPHYYQRLQQFQAEAPIAPDDIVFLGNSLIENGSWSQYFPRHKIVNRGIGGDQALGIYDRLYQILPGCPQKIFLQTGANDVSHHLPVDTIVGRVAQVIDAILRESPTTQLYLQGSLPIDESFNRYPNLAGKTAIFLLLDQRLALLAASRNIPFIPLFRLFTPQEGGDTLRKDLTTDGLHLNQRGYDIWAKAIAPYL
jgi:lysophospholipase L1-like esterase